jgi:hypothetical protein
LPAAPSDFSDAIDEKSLLNESAEIAGALPPDELAAVLEVAELELELELDELPQPAAIKAAAARVGTNARFQLAIRLSPLHGRPYGADLLLHCGRTCAARVAKLSHRLPLVYST